MMKFIRRPTKELSEPFLPRPHGAGGVPEGGGGVSTSRLYKLF